MGSSTTYQVVGMSCEHCVRAVTEELTALAGVTGVEVELPTGQVTVFSEGPLELSAVSDAIGEAGFALGS